MSKHRLNVFITLVIVLLIIAGISAWLTNESLNEAAAAREASVTPTPTMIIATAQPVKTPEPSEKPEASTAPGEDEEDSQQSEAPEQSDDPSVPKTRKLDLSGELSSSTGTNLNMTLKWTAVSKNDKTVTLTATAYIYSYTIHYGSTNGCISINGNRGDFVSDPINFDGTDSLRETKLHSYSIDLPIAVGETVSVPVSATWNFTGVYNNQEFSGITVSDYIRIAG